MTIIATIAFYILFASVSLMLFVAIGASRHWHLRPARWTSFANADERACLVCRRLERWWGECGLLDYGGGGGWEHVGRATQLPDGDWVAAYKPVPEDNTLPSLK